MFGNLARLHKLPVVLTISMVSLIAVAANSKETTKATAKATAKETAKQTTEAAKQPKKGTSEKTALVKATVVDMMSSEYGGLRIYLTPNMVKVKFQGGGEIHASAPAWKVVCSNPTEKTILEVPWEVWKKNGFPTIVDLRKDHFVSPATRIKKTTILDRPALKIIAPFSGKAASAILPPRSSKIKDLDVDSKPDTISVVGAELNAGKRQTELVQSMLKTPAEVGFPLEIAVHYYRGYTGVTVHTRSITIHEFPTSFFAYPTGYPNKVRTPEVAIAGNQLERAFQGLLDDRKNDQ